MKDIKNALRVTCILFAVLIVVLITARKDMPQYPSYDWSARDGYYLAAVSANTKGTAWRKQMEIIDVLDHVWTERVPIEDYVARSYELTKIPTQKDYELVSLVKERRWK